MEHLIHFLTCGFRGKIEIKIKFAILEILSILFGWTWIGAAIVSVYFLYAALSNEAPANYMFFSYLLWSIGAGLIAKNLAATFSSSRSQVDYVDQLVERGYTHAEATSAWEIVSKGGSNLLLNLQQTDSIAETDQCGVERHESNTN